MDTTTQPRIVVLAVVALALGAFALGGCNAEFNSYRTLTMQVSGTPGVQITGQYILSTGDESTRFDIEREVPFTVELTGDDLSCVVQKLGGAGTVRVQLLVDGQPVAFDWTRDEFGNISVATP